MKAATATTKGNFKNAGLMEFIKLIFPKIEMRLKRSCAKTCDPMT